jgi:hypothetical protein
MKLSDYFGAVQKCPQCTNSNPETPMNCVRCFCRGFLAQCLRCQGKKQIEEPVAGAATGTMKSTCGICGGKGEFAVNKPQDWDRLHPAEIPAEAVTA